MKNKILTVYILIFIICITSICLTACKNIEYTLNFIVGDETYATVITNGNEKIELPKNPTKERYLFDGWFWDNGTWQRPFERNSLLTEPISADTSVYAKFVLDEDYGSCGHNSYVLTEVMTENRDGIPRSAKFVCSVCQHENVKTITGQNLGMPVVNFDGSLDGISKKNKVTLTATYDDGDMIFTSKATLKWQGSSSLTFPKKNYTIQFINENGENNKIEIVPKWGKQSKYCLKANYIDASQARNVVSGKIYGQLAKSRNITDDYSNLINGGAIDGFPILIYHNDVYQGLYTLNIPKDKWLFAMNETNGKSAILAGDDWKDSVALKEPIAEDFSNGWELEYCSTESTEGTYWVVKSFNDMIKFITDNDGQNFVRGIRKYINVERCIDAMIYTYVICAEDNTSKNILWTTYNGVQWTCSVYDMDGTWGLHCNGAQFFKPNDVLPTTTDDNLLWKKLRENFDSEIKERYTELRKNVLSEQNIVNNFKLFFDKIPNLLYRTDYNKWVQIPCKDRNHFEQISSFVSERFTYLDAIWLN